MLWIIRLVAIRWELSIGMPNAVLLQRFWLSVTSTIDYTTRMRKHSSIGSGIEWMLRKKSNIRSIAMLFMRVHLVGNGTLDTRGISWWRWRLFFNVGFQCVICMQSEATIQTFPCTHQVSSRYSGMASKMASGSRVEMCFFSFVKWDRLEPWWKTVFDVV